MSLRKFYVYQYELSNGLPYYIGKGSNNRINESHLPWIEIPELKYRTIVKNNLTEDEAFDLELLLIKTYGRISDGGILKNKKITRWVSQAGWKHSEETKRRLSEKNLGKTRSEEQKKNYLGTKTPEHAAKVRDAVKKLWSNPEYKEKRLSQIREKPFAHKGKPWSEARRAAQEKRKLDLGEK